MTTSFDLIIIGGGPGGYHAAYLGGKARLRTLLIERDQLGGVCLNAGCIPTKTLLRSVKALKSVQQATAFGVEMDVQPQLNYPRVLERQREIMDGLREGVRALMARHQIEVIQGEAEAVDRQTVRVGDTTYSTNNLIIATGATPTLPDIPGVDQPHIRTTTQLLRRDALPEQLMIVGNNPISLGFASIYAPLGVTVHVVVPDREILPDFEPEIATGLREAMTGVHFHLGADVQAVTESGARLTNGGAFDADVIVFNRARQPNLECLDALSLDIHDGRPRVDEHMRTNLPGVYAVGDVTGRSQWAHTATREAEVAVSNILGTPAAMRYDNIPVPVYTVPEAAAIGLTERTASEQGYNTRVARLPLSANGRYRIEQADDSIPGLCKLIVDSANGRLLGAHLLGEGSVDMAFGIAALLEDEFRIEDVLGLTFAHPTVPEILKDTLHTLRS